MKPINTHHFHKSILLLHTTLIPFSILSKRQDTLCAHVFVNIQANKAKRKAEEV